MLTIAGVDIYSVRGQIVVMLLEALRVDGGSTRRGTADSIADRGWFDIRSEDWPPYPTQENREPRWRTLVAWGRKDAFDHKLLSDIGYNSWELSRAGQEQADLLRQKFEKKELDVRRCYMWRAQFKKFMCSTHQPSGDDAERPPRIYEDQIDWNLLREALRALAALENPNQGDRPPLKSNE
jgi:hypothetical protein